MAEKASRTTPGAVVFFGSGAFGVPTLRALRDRVIAIVTQPDKPAGRGGHLSPTPVAEFAAAELPGVPLLKPADVNAPEVLARVRGLAHAPGDAWVVIAFGQKLSTPLLEGRFAINLHASLLPRWRGAAPIHAAIRAGDRVTGNSVITLAERMDAGRVLGTSERTIEPHHTTGELHDLLASDGPALVQRVLAEHASGTLHAVTQDESRVTIAKKLSKRDRVLDLSVSSAPAARCAIHAMNPWPTVTVLLRGEELKLLRAQDAVASHSPHPAGTLVDAEHGVVACAGNTLLRVVEVQPAGKRAMGWGEFARGRRVTAGEVLETLRVS